jgi:hypothetical protein
VGALAHYLENNGIPTTQISLIAKHTEIIKPPRALWVPFELGRPLGTPNQPQFQTKVALAALKLLEAEQGPVLEYFAEEAPESDQGESDESVVWACPVNFSPDPGDKNAQEELADALHRELDELRPWYDLGLERHGRTALAAFTPEAAASLIADYLVNGSPSAPPKEFTPGVALRLAAQDLRAFYFEAASSRPGAGVPNSQAFNSWFWNETAAGKTLQEVKETCLQSADKVLRMTAKMFLVPMLR